MYRAIFLNSREFDINDLQIALINFICSLKNGVKFSLYIDDLNFKIDENFMQNLKLFGLHECPKFSSESLKYARQFGSLMLQNKKAYVCFCENSEKKCNCKNLSDHEVLDNENPFKICLKDGDFSILDAKKYPSLNFFIAICDMIEDVKTAFIHKSQEKNSLKQKQILASLGYEKEIKFSFIKNLKFTDKKHQSVDFLLNDGFLPSAIINYLLAPNDIALDIKELSKIFDLKSILSLNFDLKKLQNINEKHKKIKEK